MEPRTTPTRGTANGSPSGPRPGRGERPVAAARRASKQEISELVSAFSTIVVQRLAEYKQTGIAIPEALKHLNDKKQRKKLILATVAAIAEDDEGNQRLVEMHALISSQELGKKHFVELVLEKFNEVLKSKMPDSIETLEQLCEILMEKPVAEEAQQIEIIQLGPNLFIAYLDLMKMTKLLEIQCSGESVPGFEDIVAAAGFQTPGIPINIAQIGRNVAKQLAEQEIALVKVEGKKRTHSTLRPENIGNDPMFTAAVAEAVMQLKTAGIVEGDTRTTLTLKQLSTQ